jgi:hypothetical protein
MYKINQPWGYYGQKEKKIYRELDITDEIRFAT